ncbi:hypothetical protein M096_1014 [Parabacteroides distasonis str. 3999B T(B) 6]|nr:hypothetical protein M096_1014 [Parabacteroides distasonis str. 3999B T(B) 6]KDS71642.1 hypothetical protein M095_1257 [Parabacteroides distasonis str. 3999B T(B) 4]
MNYFGWNGRLFFSKRLSNRELLFFSLEFGSETHLGTE